MFNEYVALVLSECVFVISCVCCVCFVLSECVLISQDMYVRFLKVIFLCQNVSMVDYFASDFKASSQVCV